MAAIKIQRGNFDAANRRVEGKGKEGRANERRSGYETHFGLGAKVDLIEFWPSDSASGSGCVFDALPLHLPFSPISYFILLARAERGPSVLTGKARFLP